MIPDDDPKGISNSIVIQDHGTIADIEIGVKIIHSYAESEEMKGIWVLHVADSFKRDVGRLQKWSINLKGR